MIGRVLCPLPLNLGRIYDIFGQYGRNDAVSKLMRLAASNSSIFDLRNKGPQKVDLIELPGNSQHQLVNHVSETFGGGSYNPAESHELTLCGAGTSLSCRALPKLQIHEQNK